MTEPLIRPQVSNVERGHAEVDVVVTEDNELVACLGTVRLQLWTGRTGIRYAKWFAYDNRGNRIGIYYSTRKAAVNALWKKFVGSIGKRMRRNYRITLKSVGL